MISIWNHYGIKKAPCQVQKLLFPANGPRISSEAEGKHSLPKTEPAGSAGCEALCAEQTAKKNLLPGLLWRIQVPNYLLNTNKKQSPVK